MLLSLLLTVAAPFSNNSCLLSSALLPARNCSQCFSSAPFFLPSSSFPGKSFGPKGLGRPFCTTRGAVTGPAGSIALLWEHPVLSQCIQHLIPPPSICSVTTKHFDTSFQFPGYEHCCRKGMFYDLLHPFNRELSTHWPFKKFNNFLIFFFWSFSLGQNYSVSSVFTH